MRTAACSKVLLLWIETISFELEEILIALCTIVLVNQQIFGYFQIYLNILQYSVKNTIMSVLLLRLFDYQKKAEQIEGSAKEEEFINENIVGSTLVVVLVSTFHESHKSGVTEICLSLWKVV